MNSPLEDVRFLSHLLNSYEEFLLFGDKHNQNVKDLITDDLLCKSSYLDMSKNPRYEALIITVIDPEFEMLRKVFEMSHFAIFETSNLKLYEATDSNHPDSVFLVAKIGRAGNIYSTLLTERILTLFNVKIAILCGIAAGIREKIELGDVVVSAQVYYYELEKLMPLKRANRAKPVSSSSKVSNIIKDMPREIVHSNLTALNGIYTSNIKYQAEKIEYELTQNGSVRKDRKGKPKIKSRTSIKELRPKLFTDKDYIVLSGEKLFADGKTITEYSENHDLFRACEMEGAGFALSCYSNNIDWVIIRGISDFGDEKKNDTFHHAASLGAAYGTKLFLDSFLMVD